MIHFSKNSVLKELAISGLLMDAKPSNEYDARSNSLKISASQTYTLLGFNLLKVDRLTVADNIFINGSHGTVEPYIYPMSNETVVTFQNNFFINNRFPTSTKGRTYKGAKVKELNFVHNSFILNWPLNPDPTSSNVGVINLYTQDCCGQFTLEGNLFAFNPGGAMQQDHLWERMPNTRIRNNLFYMNAMLFEKDASDAGVIVGKFGLNPSYLIADLEMLEDEFDYDVSGNVSMDPQLPLTFPDLLAVDSNDVSRQNSSMNDVRQLFGMNQQGGRVAIANYAPAVPYNRPFPQNEGAKKFGVQPTALYPVP